MGLTHDKILMTVALRMGYKFSVNPVNDSIWYFTNKKQKEHITIHNKDDSFVISHKEKEILDMIQIVHDELWKEYCGEED